MIQLHTRVARALDRWYTRYPDGSVVWVAHGGTIGVLINPQAAGIPELSLLLVLGLYNILIEKRDSAAASASASF